MTPVEVGQVRCSTLHGDALWLVLRATEPSPQWGPQWVCFNLLGRAGGRPERAARRVAGVVLAGGDVKAGDVRIALEGAAVFLLLGRAPPAYPGHKLWDIVALCAGWGHVDGERSTLADGWLEANTRDADL